VRDAGEFGVNVPPGTEVDFGMVMERMRKLRSDISPHNSVKRFPDLGIDVFLGQGKFIDSSIIAVGDTKLKFAKAVICTGARASAPPIDGLDTVPYLTSETLLFLTELPERIGIICAGPIGCEMAQSFARFGAEVFLVESAPGILIKEDPDAAAVIREQLAHIGLNPAEAEKRGIEITTFTQPMSGVGRAILEGKTDGFCRIHVKIGSDKIVGTTIVAKNAGDMIGAIYVAMTRSLVLLFTRITLGRSFFHTGKGKLANLERTTGFFESLGFQCRVFMPALWRCGNGRRDLACRRLAPACCRSTSCGGHDCRLPLAANARQWSKATWRWSADFRLRKHADFG